MLHRSSDLPCRAMNSQTKGFWLASLYQMCNFSLGASLKSNRIVPGYSHNNRATAAQITTSCLIVCHHSSQGSSCGKAIDAFFPYRTFQGRFQQCEASYKGELSSSLISPYLMNKVCNAFNNRDLPSSFVSHSRRITKTNFVLRTSEGLTNDS